MAVRFGAQPVTIRRASYSRPGFAESVRHLRCLQDPRVRRRNMVTDAELAFGPMITFSCLASQAAVEDSLGSRKAVLD